MRSRQLTDSFTPREINSSIYVQTIGPCLTSCHTISSNYTRGNRVPILRIEIYTNTKHGEFGTAKKKKNCWLFFERLASDESDRKNKAKKEGSTGVSALWELNIFVRIIPNVMNN